MPASKRDHVHRLIRAMDPNEKRYFKLHVARHVTAVKGVHELLFDAIAAQEEYDEQLLHERFAGKPFMKRFAVTKHRLYEAVLRSLEAFHAEASVDARLRSMLDQAEILRQKALYPEARRMLRGARRMAQEHDRQTMLLEVLYQERRLLEDSNYNGVKDSEVGAMVAEGEALHAGIAEVDALWALKTRLFMLLYRKGMVQGRAGRAALDKLLRDPLLRDAGRLHSAHARYLFHHVHSAAAFAMGDMEACRSALEANHRAMQQDRTFFLDAPNRVFPVLSNLIHVCLRTGRFTQAADLLKEFREMPARWNMPETEDLELKLFSTGMSLELDMHCSMGAFSRAMELLPVVERGLQRHADRINPLRSAALSLQMAYAAFGAGRMADARQWCNRMLNTSRVGVSEELVRHGTLFNLLLLLESKAWEMLPHALRNAERMLGAHGGPGVEVALVALVRGLAKMRDPLAWQPALEAFLGTVEQEQGAADRSLTDHFDLKAWAESKLAGRTFAEVVQERAQRLGRAA